MWYAYRKDDKLVLDTRLFHMVVLQDEAIRVWAVGIHVWAVAVQILAFVMQFWLFEQ